MNEAAAGRDYLLELSNAISCYLSLMSAIGECVGRASPEIGGVHKRRIEQLRTRIYFQSTPKTLKTSLKVMEAELSDYAVAAVNYLEQRDLEVRRTITALENAIDKLAARYSLLCGQLAELAGKSETPESAAVVISPRFAVQDLRQLAEALKDETETALGAVREEIATAEQFLGGATRTDPSTRLLNAGEITRQMEAYRASGATFSLLLFELLGPVTEPIMRQAAERLEKQFRPRDRVARWAEAEFLVLFHGPADVAEARGTQVAKLLAGNYELASGRKVEIIVHSQLLDPEISHVLIS